MICPLSLPSHVLSDIPSYIRSSKPSENPSFISSMISSNEPSHKPTCVSNNLAKLWPSNNPSFIPLLVSSNEPSINLSALSVFAKNRDGDTPLVFLKRDNDRDEREKHSIIQQLVLVVDSDVEAEDW